MYYLADSLYQLDTLIKLLGTPSGVFLAAVIVAMFLCSFGRPGRWVVLTTLLFTSTLSFGVEALRNPLIPPFEQVRFAAEPLVYTFAAFLALPSFLAPSTHLRTPLLAATFAFWIFEMIYSLHMAVSVDLQRGLLSMAIFTTYLISFGFGMPRWIRGIADVHTAARCMGTAAFLFILGTTAQVIVNRHAIIFSNRLYAITGNPQHAAFILAIVLLPICVLIASKREAIPMRFFWATVAGADIAMLIWTGSRTGTLTALVGLALLFRRRIGTFVGVGLIALIFVFFFLALFQPDAATGSRILSLQDTRTGVWASLFEKFQANPFFGTMSKTDYTAAESSYLTVAAHMGLLGLGLVGIVVCFLAGALRRGGRLRSTLQSEDDLILVDWVSAGLIAIFVGAFFEGVLVATLNLMLVSVYFYLGLLKYISDKNTLAMAVYQPPMELPGNATDYAQAPGRFVELPRAL
ncbi:MAG TPA: O-antigen ligase family protein [Humisphaera sp.]|nr:O-antigen ligase family protein [Humisphaera sp.]